MARANCFTLLPTADERLVISYRHTDQTLTVWRSAYLRYRTTKYRNWQIRGQAQFLTPLRCLSDFIARTQQVNAHD